MSHAGVGSEGRAGDSGLGAADGLDEKQHGRSPCLAGIRTDRRRESGQHDAIPGAVGGKSGVGFLGAVEAGQSIKSTNEK